MQAFRNHMAKQQQGKNPQSALTVWIIFYKSHYQAMRILKVPLQLLETYSHKTSLETHRTNSIILRIPDKHPYDFKIWQNVCDCSSNKRLLKYIAVL